MPTKTCTECHSEKPLEDFGIRLHNTASGKKGELTAKCCSCIDRAAQRRAVREKAQRAEKRKAESAEIDEQSKTLADFEEIALETFIEVITGTEDAIDVHARVNIASLAPKGPECRARADRVAAFLGECTMLHWTYERCRRRVRTADSMFLYSCAQSASRAKKGKDDYEKTRDTQRMPRFQCDGWLHIAVSPNSDVMEISLKHRLEHVPYLDIELPEKWKTYIREHGRGQTPGQIWRHILRVESEGRSVRDLHLPFRRKAVYYYWQVASRGEWRLGDTPMESARTFLRERGDEFHVCALDVEAEPGTEVLAFYVKDFIEEWAVNTQELGMDSTWNTNGANFELFSAVADADGAGIPLAFLFICTRKEAAPGAKQLVLERFLSCLKSLGVNPEFTLSDKDWSEINAMGAIWEKAKHQLCFWHALRALKKRLSQNKEAPGPYDAEAAHRLFGFINLDFVPVAQRGDQDEIPAPPEKPRPRVRLLVDGRPLVLTPSLPKLIFTPEMIARALDHCEDEDVDEDHGGARWVSEEEEEEEEDDVESFLAEEDDLSDADTYWARRATRANTFEDEISDEDDCANKDRDDLRRVVSEGASTGPPPPTQPAGAPPKRAAYQFCPQAHRVLILRLFAKHASQHPLLPERHGQARSGEDIYRDAVTEMYHHCKANNLPEVWAYLWNSWYCKSRWHLWARSAYPTSIPRKRTTMMVEALWCHLKRLVLYQFNRPPLDLTLYALITQALPSYRLALHDIITNSRAGRSAVLSPTQVALKRAWKRLFKVPIRGTYTTNVTAWTCDCGAQKYHAYLLCKHLVQAAGRLPISWWPQAIRYHVPPFYTVPINGVTTSAPEKIRDHAWLPRMAASRAFTVVTQGAPRIGEDSDIEIPDVDAISTASSISSSPGKAAPTGRDGLMRTRAGDGAGFELDDDEDQEVDAFIESFQQAYIILKEQKDKAGPSFIATAMRRMRAVPKWVREIQHSEHRRTMPMTNGRHRHTDPDPSTTIGYWYAERE
ncbi:hypothetical protein ONZ51_g8667 [Trametes cubensis]|uniref:SWIM-type domain-containing protein n=1 Tax=Trametes cubensis TaxID=1111947 RepID=A0AAD7TP12_9APHY|nr:hypothetical protein ONZ51_g8667 [Trametes cubensis]